MFKRFLKSKKKNTKETKRKIKKETKTVSKKKIITKKVKPSTNRQPLEPQISSSKTLTAEGWLRKKRK